MYPASSSVCSVQVKVQQNEVFQALLDEFPTITRPPTAITPIKHKVTHHIITKGPAVYARAQPIAPEKLKIAKAEVNIMLRLGVICP